MCIYIWYVNPYYWADKYPLLNENNGSLDPSTFDGFIHFFGLWFQHLIGAVPIFSIGSQLIHSCNQIENVSQSGFIFHNFKGEKTV